MLDKRLEAAIKKSLGSQEDARTYYARNSTEFALMVSDLMMNPIGKVASYKNETLKILVGKTSFARAKVSDIVKIGDEAVAIVVDGKLLLLKEDNKKAVVYEMNETNQFAICYMKKVR